MALAGQMNSAYRRPIPSLRWWISGILFGSTVMKHSPGLAKSSRSNSRIPRLSTLPGRFTSQSANTWEPYKTVARPCARPHRQVCSAVKRWRCVPSGMGRTRGPGVRLWYLSYKNVAF